MALPTRSQLLLPLLEVLQDMGGRAKPADAIAALNDRFQVPVEVQEKTVEYSWAKWGHRVRSPWRQNIHWVRQEAATRGLIDRSEHGMWTLTDKGSKSLVDCQPGTILILYETPNGQVLWADAQTAAGSMKDGTVDLIYHSPPYPLTTGRAYGTFTVAQLIELIMSCAPEWKRVLTDTGSMVLNLKDVYLPSSETGGAPERSIYIDKLVCALVEETKFHFADRHFWRNPSCAPTTPWVTVKKVRCGADIEHMLWFSKTAQPFSDSTQVMSPAKASTIATYLAKARRAQKNVVCESGHNNVFEEQIAKAARGEQILVLPRTVQEFSNAAPQVKLKALLAQAGLPPHPARMPIDLPRFWIKFLTKPGQRVHDFFLGSGTTGLACEELGREWGGNDRSLSYLLGSALRFPPGVPRFSQSGLETAA